MTVIRGLLSGFVKFISWLCFEHQWTESQLMIISGASVVLLLLILIRLRKRSVTHINAPQIHEATPIIGVNLAEYSQRHQIARNTANSSQTQGRPGNWKQMTRQFAKSNEQIKRLQHELAKRKQSESNLEQKLAEAKDANKRLKDEIAAGRPSTSQSELQIAEMKTTIEKLRDEIGRRRQKQEQLEQQVAELKSRCEQIQEEESKTAEPEQALKSKRLDDPLNIEELKKVSALAKRVSGRTKTTA